MRIVGGLYRSRQLKMVGVETTRETQDQVRESIFNLMSFLEIKGNVLDLFSGSGSMGLEALSRGADFAYFCDINKKAYYTTLDNIKALKLENKTKVYNQTYEACLKNLNAKFDFVFLDPPYALKVCDEISVYMLAHGMLTEDAVIVIEVAKETEIKEIPGLHLYKERDYGIKKVVILRRD